LDKTVNYTPILNRKNSSSQMKEKKRI